MMPPLEVVVVDVTRIVVEVVVLPEGGEGGPVAPPVVGRRVVVVGGAGDEAAVVGDVERAELAVHGGSNERPDGSFRLRLEVEDRHAALDRNEHVTPVGVQGRRPGVDEPRRGGEAAARSELPLGVH